MSDETTEEPFPDRADGSFDDPPAEFTDAFTDDFAAEPTGDLADECSDAPAAMTDGAAVRPRPSRSAPTQPAFSQTARRIVWDPRTRIAVVSLALVAMMFLFVFPTRSYLAQKRQIGQAAHAVKVLEAQNQVLARQASRLKTKSEIERLAREQFNMVLPGEQAYNVVETPSGSTDTSTTTVP